MTTVSFTWRLAAGLVTSALGIFSAVTLLAGAAASMCRPVAGLLGVKFAMKLMAARRGAGMTALYPDGRSRAFILTAELVAVLCALVLLVGG